MSSSRTFHATAFLGITIDGYIARADGSVDYLPPAPEKPESTTPPAQITAEKVPTMADMLSTMSVLIMGRATYDTVLQLIANGETWPYGDVPVIVLTSSPITNLRDNVTVVSSIDEVIRHAEEKGYKTLWIDGGRTVRSFMEMGMLDDVVLTTIPVILGNGIGLFTGLKREVKCEVVAAEMVGGYLGVKYKVLYGDVDKEGRLVGKC